MVDTQGFLTLTLAAAGWLAAAFGAATDAWLDAGERRVWTAVDTRGK